MSKISGVCWAGDVTGDDREAKTDGERERKMDGETQRQRAEYNGASTKSARR